MSATRTVFYGPLVTPIALDSYAVLPNAALGIGPTGNIEWIIGPLQPELLQETLAQKGYADAHRVELKTGEFIMPGFIDTHTVCCSSHIRVLINLSAYV